jgi:hypothetical protein
MQAQQTMAHSYIDRLKAFLALLTTNAVVDKKCGHQDSTAANETGVVLLKMEATACLLRPIAARICWLI